MRLIVLGASLLLLAVSAGSGGGLAVSGAAVSSAGFGNVDSVSCGAPGDCSAGGFYFDGSSNRRQAFVVSETNGAWGNPIEVPATARLNAGDRAEVVSVSCAAPGDCAAGGYYTDGNFGVHAFVVSETNGRWGKAIEVPGLITGGDAEVRSVSCGTVGACVAAGHYNTRQGDWKAFVASERNGRWGKPIEVPGTARLNTGDGIDVNSVSCAAPGECAAGGYYDTRGGHNYGPGPGPGVTLHAFVVSETNGRWGKAIEVPGTARAKNGGGAEVNSVSCPAAGDCVAGGWYLTHGANQAFVASETNGSWGTAIAVPGTARLNSGDQAEVDSVSCAAPGECAAGGGYTDDRPHQAFVVSETNGSWGNAIEAPGTATLNTGGSAGVASISCATAGECAAGGFYRVGSSLRASSLRAFVLSETHGSWGNAIEAPGTATPVSSISCPAVGDCVASGPGDIMETPVRPGFVVTETNGTWDNAIRVRNFPASCVVPNLLGKPIRAAEKALNTAHCRVGKITHAYSNLKKGRVVAQHPKPGRHLKGGASVALTVSKGMKT